MTDLSELLFQKYLRQQLAQFYIITTPSKMKLPHEEVSKFMHDFLHKVIVHEKDVNDEEADEILSLGHSDILEIRPEEPSKPYLVENFDEFMYFLNFYNFELPHRFCVVYYAQNIVEKIANKLLKVLEEPPKNTTIFFLNSSSQTFLPTIKSRAIELKLPAINRDDLGKTLESIDEMEQFLKNEGDKRGINENYINRLIEALHNPLIVSDFLANKKITGDDWHKISLLLIDFNRSRKLSYQQSADLLKAIDDYAISKSFYNPNWQRVLRLINISKF